jgi:stage III sporulation protein AB
MARALGAAMVVVAAVLIGRVLSRPYRARVQAVQEWVACLERVRVELTFRKRPLTQAFAAAAQGIYVTAAAKRLGERLAAGDRLKAAVSAAVGEDWRLGQEERALIEALIPPLSSAPAEWQNDSLAAGGRELSRILADIRAECAKKCRMLETLSTLAGLTAVLILL